METKRGSRSQVKPRWKSSIVALIAASSCERRPATVSAPLVLGSSIDRSRPAENAGPSPRTTTTRTSSGSPAPIVASARHIAGVWLLRESGRSRVTVAVAPSTSRRRPTAASSSGLMAGV